MLCLVCPHNTSSTKFPSALLLSHLKETRTNAIISCQQLTFFLLSFGPVTINTAAPTRKLSIDSLLCTPCLDLLSADSQSNDHNLSHLLHNRYKTIDQGTIGLVTRFGRYYKTVDPGLIRLNPYTESVYKVDMRIQVSHILDQVIMSKPAPIFAFFSSHLTVIFSPYSSLPVNPIAKDNVNVHIDSVVYWHVIDPFQSTYGISNVQQALVERTKTTLRQVLGAKVLQEIIENREQLGHEIQEIIDVPAHAWGVAVESILIKDIQFSKSLQEALSSAAQAKRIAESKVIQAQSEVDSAKLMRQAAECKSFFCLFTSHADNFIEKKSGPIICANDLPCKRLHLFSLSFLTY